MADKRKTQSRRTTRGSVPDSEKSLTAKTNIGDGVGEMTTVGNQSSIEDCFDGNGGEGPITVRLGRTTVAPTSDLTLWALIRKSTEAISFNNYESFMKRVFEHFLGLPSSFDDEAAKTLKKLKRNRALPFRNIDPYLILKVGTEFFLAVKGAVDTNFPAGFGPRDADAVSRTLDGQRVTAENLECLWNVYRDSEGDDDNKLIPYFDIISRRIDTCGRGTVPATFAASSADSAESLNLDYVLSEKLYKPYMFELIWSYWHEEGMLVQTMNAIARRFQNIRGPGADRDPLANLEISGLFTLSNLLWGYIQDEQHRLSIIRRAYEYDHQYGITLKGRAIPPLNTADSRSKFIEAFHHLLHLASRFFRQDDDATVRADGFPLLSDLRDVHILLSQGAHNQFGDLPSTARQEMLEQQFILSRPEFAQFLPVRLSVGYPEGWMDRVDAMKSLQGWNDSTSAICDPRA